MWCCVFVALLCKFHIFFFHILYTFLTDISFLLLPVAHSHSFALVVFSKSHPASQAKRKLKGATLHGQALKMSIQQKKAKATAATAGGDGSCADAGKKDKASAKKKKKKKRATEKDQTNMDAAASSPSHFEDLPTPTKEKPKESVSASAAQLLEFTHWSLSPLPHSRKLSLSSYDVPLC